MYPTKAGWYWVRFTFQDGAISKIRSDWRPAEITGEAPFMRILIPNFQDEPGSHRRANEKIEIGPAIDKPADNWTLDLPAREIS